MLQAVSLLTSDDLKCAILALTFLYKIRASSVLYSPVNVSTIHSWPGNFNSLVEAVKNNKLSFLMSSIEKRLPLSDLNTFKVSISSTQSRQWLWNNLYVSKDIDFIHCDNFAESASHSISLKEYVSVSFVK